MVFLCLRGILRWRDVPVGARQLAELVLMSTPLIPGVAQQFESDRLKFPAMLPEETLVMRAWLALYQHLYDAFDYNTRIGSGDVPPNVANESVIRDAVLNSQLRIDAIGWQGIVGYKSLDGTYRPADVYALFPNARATIIEVKRRAATAGTNAIISYKHLWADEWGNFPAPSLILACATYSNTIVPVLRAQGILLNVVAVDFSSLKPVFRKK